MESDHIGEFVIRARKGDPMAERPMTKAHRIESGISDRYVTHCGRQIGERPGTRLVFEIAVALSARCRRC